MSNPFVVVGAGLAAAKAVQALRENGYDGQLIVYGDERHLPYERPPLSKDYLLGNADLESATVNPSEWYDEQGVELRLGTTVTELDLAGHQVVAGGTAQPYGRTATGPQPHARTADTRPPATAPQPHARTADVTIISHPPPPRLPKK